jgi:DNA-binding XRE family transcriptional regulator
MLGKFILGQRKKFGLTQEYVASEISVSRPTYLQIEQGERDLTITEAKKLADIFCIPFEDFVEGRDTSILIDFEKPDKPPASKKQRIRISVPQKNMAKFKAVLIYILKKVGGKTNVGMTVLYKLLYFIDFDYYEKYEEQLMGLIYLKNQLGPTPLLFDNLIEDLIKKGEVEKISSKFYKYPQTKYLVDPKIMPDLSVLTGQEQQHIDWELDRLCESTAAQLSALSHKDVPWISAADGKPLDYESVFYRTPETSVRIYGDAVND